MKTTIDHVTEGELAAEVTLRDAKIHANANAIAMVQGNLDDMQSQLNTVKGDLNSLRSMVNQNDGTLHDRLDVTNEALDSLSSECQSLVERITALEALHSTPDPEPTPDPIPDPSPVETPHTKAAYLANLVKAPQEVTFRQWNAPPRVGDVTLTEDVRWANVACDALASSDLSEVIRLHRELLTKTNRDGTTTYPWYGGRNLRVWSDNDVHGRCAYAWDTMLWVKRASLGDQEAVDWVAGMLAGDEDKYSPYKIANSLIAWGPDGGIQQTGKHYAPPGAGWGHGYEGMWCNVPFLLLYVWEQFTGEDLISKIPCYQKIYETIDARTKPYWTGGLFGPRTSFTIANMAPSLPGIEANVEGLVNWPLREPPEPTKIPRNQWVWRRGDGVLQWKGGINIDVTAPAVAGQRSEFVPRCIGVMNTKEDAGLPFVHHFKGGCSPRSCSGLILGPYNANTGDLFGSVYQEDGGYERPQSGEACLETLHREPLIEGDIAKIEWPMVHGRLGQNFPDAFNHDESPYNVRSVVRRVRDKVVVIEDFITYNAAKRATLTFTSSSLTSIKDGEFVRRWFQCDWGTIEVFGGSVWHAQINETIQEKRDDPQIDELWNPYGLDIIKSQVFVEFAPATSHALKTIITFD